MTEVVIRSLTKTYSGPPAVNDVSLTIGHGEFVSLLGPSGCGKTTTLKLIAGFEEADAGAILFDGQDVGRLPAEKRDIGMVFQSYALFPHLTVAGNIAFGLEMRGIERREIDRRVTLALETVQLKGLEARYPRQLSGGQQQRVALARALVIEPRILLLDEPLANLDARLRDEMRYFIRDLQRRIGITTIYVTHDQAEALTMSDRVVVMFGGKVAQAGAPMDIYQKPASRAVAEFVGRVNVLKGTILAGKSNPRRVSTLLGDFDLPPSVNGEAGQTLDLALRPESMTMQAAADGPAKVIAAAYSGGLIDYRVEVCEGEILHVQTFPASRFGVGDRVTVTTSDNQLWPLENQP
jgi:putative spermidine/putrescine transport system ATP-binding protein